MSFLIHGTTDDVVWSANSETFAERLRAHGVAVTLKLYAETGHAEVVAAMAPPLEFTGDTLKDSLTFMDYLSDGSEL